MRRCTRTFPKLALLVSLAQSCKPPHHACTSYFYSLSHSHTDTHVQPVGAHLCVALHFCRLTCIWSKVVQHSCSGQTANLVPKRSFHENETLCHFSLDLDISFCYQRTAFLCLTPIFLCLEFVKCSACSHSKNMCRKFNSEACFIKISSSSSKKMMNWRHGENQYCKVYLGCIDPYWSPSTQTPTFAAPESGPASVSGTVLNSSSISLTWTDIPGDLINGIIAGYLVQQRYRQFLATSDWSLWVPVATTREKEQSKNFSGLLPSTDYQYRVTGSTAAGYGTPPVYTVSELVTTAEDGTSPRKIQFSFSSPASPPLNYLVYTKT